MQLKVIHFFFILLALLAIAIGYFFYIFGGNVTYAEQWPIYEGLRNTSSIIFAVMGAWLAILYPSKLAMIFEKKDGIYKINEIQEVRRLIAPLIYSTLVLAFVMIVALITPIAKQFEYVIIHKKTFQGISFVTLGLLTLIQLWSLILSLIPNDCIKQDLDTIQNRGEIIEKMRPNSKNIK